jgi:hypothetical protein
MAGIDYQGIGWMTLALGNEKTGTSEPHAKTKAFYRENAKTAAKVARKSTCLGGLRGFLACFAVRSLS